MKQKLRLKMQNKGLWLSFATGVFLGLANISLALFTPFDVMTPLNMIIGLLCLLGAYSNAKQIQSDKKLKE